VTQKSALRIEQDLAEMAASRTLTKSKRRTNSGVAAQTLNSSWPPKGYVVLYTNPRGSTSYGAEFGNLIHHAYPGDDFYDLNSGSTP
jgi:hypothetical protein